MGEETKKILITDDSMIMEKIYTEALSQDGVELRIARDGKEGLEMLESFQPDLVFLDLMLPSVHGIDILKAIKSNPKTRNTGVIISTGKALIQDYQAAVTLGADYYLIKPFKPTLLQNLVSRFFTGALEVGPFPQNAAKQKGKEENLYNPQVRKSTSNLRFLGTRGSIPVAGLEYYRYGGNTVCIEHRTNNELVVIDAGTGIRELGNEIMNSDIRDIHLFIGHTHWDHILGFPFFAPVYDSKFTINIYAARGFKKSVKELFTGMLDHDYFPVRLDEMQAGFVFHDLDDGEPIQVGETKIHYHYAMHPGATLCFKIETPRKTIGYATDNEFLVGYHGHPNDLGPEHPIVQNYRHLINFYTGCDILVHEAQYTSEDYLSKVGWGHSSIPNAAALLKYTGVKEWIITHHDPSETDLTLLDKLSLARTILDECEIDASVHMAYDGLVLPI